MTSTALSAGDARGTDWITAGSVDELAVITGLPLPAVPAQWLRQRWRSDDRWVRPHPQDPGRPDVPGLAPLDDAGFPPHPGQ